MSLRILYGDEQSMIAYQTFAQQRLIMLNQFHRGLIVFPGAKKEMTCVFVCSAR